MFPFKKERLQDSAYRSEGRKCLHLFSDGASVSWWVCQAVPVLLLYLPGGKNFKKSVFFLLLDSGLWSLYLFCLNSFIDYKKKYPTKQKSLNKQKNPTPKTITEKKALRQNTDVN